LAPSLSLRLPETDPWTVGLVSRSPPDSVQRPSRSLDRTLIGSVQPFDKAGGPPSRSTIRGRWGLGAQVTSFTATVIAPPLFLDRSRGSVVGDGKLHRRCIDPDVRATIASPSPTPAAPSSPMVRLPPSSLSPPLDLSVEHVSMCLSQIENYITH
jgi:hypothetical protein